MSDEDTQLEKSETEKSETAPERAEPVIPRNKNRKTQEDEQVAEIEEGPVSVKQEIQEAGQSLKELMGDSKTPALVLILIVLVLVFFNMRPGVPGLDDQEEQMYAAFEAENPQDVLVVPNLTQDNNLRAAALIKAGDLYLRTSREKPFTSSEEKAKAMQQALNSYLQAAKISDGRNVPHMFSAMIGTALTLDEIGETDNAIVTLEKALENIEKSEDFKAYPHYKLIVQNYLRLMKLPVPENLSTIHSNNALLGDDLDVSLWDSHRVLPPFNYGNGPVAPMGPIDYPQVPNG